MIQPGFSRNLPIFSQARGLGAAKKWFQPGFGGLENGLNNFQNPQNQAETTFRPLFGRADAPSLAENREISAESWLNHLADAKTLTGALRTCSSIPYQQAFGVLVVGVRYRGLGSGA